VIRGCSGNTAFEKSLIVLLKKLIKKDFENRKKGLDNRTEVRYHSKAACGGDTFRSLRYELGA